MCITKTMSKRSKSIDKAIRDSKKAFNNRCIFSGELYPNGCHIYFRTGKYRFLADNQFNIIPAINKHHTMMDRDKNGIVISPEKRIEFIRLYVLPEFKSLVEERLEILESLVNE